MTTETTGTATIQGARGWLHTRRWEGEQPRRIVVIVHGFGEHGGRYAHVAQQLAADGAVVYAPDLYGHGASDGERAQVDDVGAMLDDLRSVVAHAGAEHPGLPIAMIGHSMGGLLATRYVQQGDCGLAALVLSGPVIGGNPGFEALLEMDPIPDVPIDPGALSRDPAVGAAYTEDPLVYHGPLTRATLESFVAAVDAVAAGPGFGSLPVLWIHGEEDPLAPLPQTRSAIERLAGETFEARVYPGARHEIFNETNREEVISEAAGFITRAVPG